MTLDECERIFDGASASKTESEFCYAIDPLLREYETLSLGFKRGGSIYWRARLIENEVYSNIANLDYPPPEKARQGRLNDRGVPCFYISTRIETALAEVGAVEGQLVQLAGFKVPNESLVRLAVIGEYFNVQKNGYMHFAGSDPDLTIAKALNAMGRKDALKKIYIDKFFANVLADPDASDNGYMFSRALGQLIYSRSGADGIAFPSVKDRGGFNIAVKAEPSDKCFENVSCLVVRMPKQRRLGIVELNILKSASHLDDDWNFVWPENHNPEIVGFYNMSKDEYDAAIRDPDDRNNHLNMLYAKTKRP